jgi:glycosyltransferase involved in cell wall biosynthesis
VVSGGVVVDVDHAARHDLHTGIQQVVRRTLPVWARDHPLVAVAWTDERAAWRTLSDPERHRVFHHGAAATPHGAAQDGATGDGAAPAGTLVIPWRSVVVLAETPSLEACSRLAALAQYSGNRVVAVGYDCIPVVSADLVPDYEPQRFCRYLTVLKYAQRIAAVSSSAAAEFTGFAAALPAQGLPGPAVAECTLPAGPAAGPPDPAPDQASPPLVVCVASLEPRKNHLGLLYAAERLWRDGHHFQLLLIAGSGWGEEIPARIRHLQQAGRPLTVRNSPPDTEVAAAYQTARFSVLASLHEGYGLPVAESLAWGTPAITSNYGSTNEIAAAGGAITIDPRDDEALVEAMRRLLTDDHLLATLRHQARARTPRSWEHYATELWDQLIEPELPHHPTPHAPDAPGGHLP